MEVAINTRLLSSRTRIRVTATSGVLVLAVVGAAVGATASAAAIRPMTFSCGQVDGWSSCVDLEGSASYVDYWEGSSSPYDTKSGQLYHVEFNNPRGALICNGPQENGGNLGDESECGGDPNADELGGEYTATTWVWGGGTYYYDEGYGGASLPLP